MAASNGRRARSMVSAAARLGQAGATGQLSSPRRRKLSVTTSRASAPTPRIGWTGAK